MRTATPAGRYRRRRGILCTRTAAGCLRAGPRRCAPTRPRPSRAVPRGPRQRKNPMHLVRPPSCRTGFAARRQNPMHQFGRLFCRRWCAARRPPAAPAPTRRPEAGIIAVPPKPHAPIRPPAAAAPAERPGARHFRAAPPRPMHQFAQPATAAAGRPPEAVAVPRQRLEHRADSSPGKPGDASPRQHPMDLSSHRRARARGNTPCPAVATRSPAASSRRRRRGAAPRGQKAARTPCTCRHCSARWCGNTPCPAERPATPHAQRCDRQHPMPSGAIGSARTARISPPATARRIRYNETSMRHRATHRLNQHPMHQNAAGKGRGPAVRPVAPHASQSPV